MKINILFALILFVSVVSCSKSNETPAPSNAAENISNYGSFGVYVRMYTAAGKGGSQAEVNIAYSADSLANGLYIETKNADSLGEVSFDNIDLGNNLTRRIYYNATLEYDGENFKGENIATLHQDRKIYGSVIVEPYEVK